MQYAEAFADNEEIMTQSKAADARLYYKRAILTIEEYPNNHELITQALYRAPFKHGLTKNESETLAEYYLANYTGWRGTLAVVSAHTATEVTAKLVQSLCKSGSTEKALFYVNSLILERGPEIYDRPKIKVYDELEHCLRKEPSNAVYLYLSEAIKKIGPVTRQNDKDDLLSLAQKVATYEVERWIESPCKLLRIKGQRKSSGDAIDKRIQMYERDKSWSMHLLAIMDAIIYETDLSILSAKNILERRFYSNKMPDWELRDSFNNLLKNMACTKNLELVKLLVQYFYDNESHAKKEDQINLVIRKLYPEKAKYKRSTRIRYRGSKNMAEVRLHYYAGPLDAHGETILLEEFEFNGKTYWFPIAAKKRKWIS
ncbi:MAG: hypothetical protein OEZ68_06480 [Gammaproteobacteria bacterium]|nr:hypothetical protein [Gammaproteobacteria bacterium]MDH5800436.1 hypothetical protein [Gammaproteobacteria bacterium]